MLDWLVQTIVEAIVVLLLGVAIGYGIRLHRSRIRVSLSTHIEQSWSERRIHMSIRNHGNTSIVVDSWTVHIPLGELLTGLPKRDDEAKPMRGKRLIGFRRFAGRIRHRLCRRNRIAMQNELSEALAQATVDELHGRHELLEPGATILIGPGESAVRNFPRTDTVSSKQPIASNAEHLTIVPSCHVVGYRRRIWGWVSFVGGGSIPWAVQINPPDED